VLTQRVIFEGLKKLISKKKIISISGQSGSGKTTLAQFLIGNLMTEEEPYNGCCLWIQTSENFSKKRLFRMFNAYPKRLGYLKENIFITPKVKPCSTYLEQSNTLKKLSEEIFLLSNLKFIVIDNISHHLRYEVLRLSDIESRISMMNNFFDFQLYPLIMLCEREEINLVLIHEISYSHNKDKEMTFFYKLYNRIDSLNISLKKEYISQEKIMEINYDELNWAFKYFLVDQGLKFKF